MPTPSSWWTKSTRPVATHSTTRWAALPGLLEHDTAQSFTDEFAEVAIDASQVIWITTANDARGIP